MVVPARASERVDILIVDDRPSSLLALESVLEPLGQNVVRAGSGRDALRLLLGRQFAVILLDVNMPGLDGFETAELIRRRPRSRHTPIIFVTGDSNEQWVSRGYALGAVDFIFAPLVPEVLRTKVRAFVDLSLMHDKIERQAESLRRRKLQWRRLTEASLAIHTNPSFEGMLRVVADTARALVGARQAYVSVALDDPPTRYGVASLADELAGWRATAEPPDPPVLAGAAAETRAAVRLTASEAAGRLAARPAAPGLRHPPLVGWLMLPLLGRDGRAIGALQLSEPAAGEFGAGDEAILEPLARMAAIAVENTVYCEAREANRLKDEFLATLSHELRTPLNAMLGWTRLLRTPSLGAADLAHGLDVIERNVRAQARLIEDLLDVSRITSGKLELERRPAPLVPVLRAALDAVRPAAEAKRIELRGRLEPADAVADIDPDRMQQVATNLLGNAVKFTPAGGRITVDLDRAGADWRIRVTDTGEGIPAALLPHVFERFRQGQSGTTRSHGGLGMGLTIVRHLVELHDGSVEAASAGPGAGAVFTVRLPVPAAGAARDAPAAPQPARETAQATLPGLRVLVVEDEADGRALLCEILTRHDASVTGVDSVAAAVDVLRRETHDIVISDIAMPEEDGHALVRRIRKGEVGRRDLPVIAVSAHARTQDHDRALEAGFDAHLPKPVDPARLIAAVVGLTAPEAAARAAKARTADAGSGPAGRA